MHMKRLIHITLATAIALLSLASCNDGRRTSRGMDAQGEVKRQVIRHAEQKADKGSVVPNAKKGIGGTLVTRKVQGRETNKDLSRLRSFRRRTVSKLFARDAADSLHLGRAQLHVPSGSMERAKLLSVTPLGKGELPHLPAGMVNVTGDRDVPVSASLKGGVAGYRLLPHGEHFVHAPATITVPYDSALIPKGYTAEDIHTYYYDELQGKWTMLRHKALDREREVVMAETSHFTDVINGIIKVPESPETQNYVPTGIAELKAADPAAGITTVNAPTPNQSGTASLGYAFELPKGRGSMQPSVGLQYGSDGGSSYVGYGWSLPVQSVDIETRWGVPRFDIEHESESYLLTGTKLGDRTYRTAELPGRAKDKRFKPLVEGGFARIIRRGDLPTNYTWEVTSKDGTTSYFGGIDGKIADNAVIKDAEGNIVRWALYRMVDTHGNFVSYTYEHHDSTLYPKCYRYTGHDDEEGAYAVNFEYAPTARKDAMSSGRLGVLQRDDRLLQRVNVTFNNESVRSYALHHREGPFAKTLLDSIVQLDAKGARVAAQGFDYYDDVKGGMFATTEERWKSQSDEGRFSHFKKRFDGVSDELSILGGASSSGGSGGGGFGIAIGPVSVGTSYELSKNKSHGEVAFTDIDGDGLPDKVFRNIVGLWYRPNLFGKDGKGGFGEPVRLQGVESFSESSSTTHNFSVDVGFGFGPASVGGSYCHINQKDKMKVYMQDFNGDGLLDIANGGTVYFNRVGPDGKPHFEQTSAGTINPIRTSDTQVVDSAFIPDYGKMRAELENTYPLHDIVRLWRAPLAGTVTIIGKVEKPATQGDGVKMAIQVGNTVLWKDSIEKGGIRNHALTCKVEAGQSVYFRLQSRYSGTADSVGWNPSIRYTTIDTGMDNYAGEDLTEYEALRDHIGGEAATAYVAETGKVIVYAPYHKERTSDDVRLVVEKVVYVDKERKATTLYGLNLKADTVASGVVKFEYDAVKSEGAMLRFVMNTTSPIDWRKVSWKPTCHYVGKDTVRLSPSRMGFAKLVSPARAREIKHEVLCHDSIENGMVVKLVARFKALAKETSDSGKVFLTIKSASGELLLRKAYPFAKYIDMEKVVMVVKDTALAAQLAERKLHVTFSTNHEIWRLDSASVKISREKYSDNFKASVFCCYDDADFGHLYRGWGQFAYNGNGKWGTLPIDPSVLKVDKGDFGEPSENDDPDPKEMDGKVKPISGRRFFSLGYDVKRDRYVSITDGAFIGGAAQSSSRIGMQEIVVDSIPYAAGGASLPAPVLETSATGEVLSANGKFTGKILSGGISGSKSEQTSYTMLSCMDVNGDGYPDWVREHDKTLEVQFTTQTGALGGGLMHSELSVPEFKASSGTIGVDVGAKLKDGKAGDGKAESPTIAEQWSFSRKSLRQFGIRICLE